MNYFLLQGSWCCYTGSVMDHHLIHSMANGGDAGDVLIRGPVELGITHTQKEEEEEIRMESKGN